MNLLGAALYDPSVAVSKATSALLAMTALDTTNLRLAITVPSHGLVTFHIRGQVTGATTAPTILIGVLNGATVLGRVTPTYENATANVATQSFVFDAEFTVSGLTPGAMNVDAAYAVQVIVASTNIKFGGPNTNAGANAWGGLVFEAWDPRPLPTATPGAANGVVIAGANAATTFATLTSTGAMTVNGVSAVSQTGDAFARLGAPAGASVSADVAAVKVDTAAVKVKTDFLPSVAAGAAGGLFLAGTNAATTVNFTGNLSGSVGSVTGAVGSVTGSVASVTGNVGGNVVGSVASVVGAVGSVTGLTAANLDAAVSTRMATYTQPSGFLAATFPTSVASPTNITAGTITTVTNLTNAPAAGDLTATMKASVTAAATAATPTAAAVTGNVGGNVVGSVASVAGAVGSVTGLNAANLDVAISTRLSSAGYTAPDNTTISTINTRIGAGGAGLTALGDTRIANLDAAVSSRSTFAGGAVSSVTGNVGGNVVGSVASVVGSVGSVTGLVAGNLDAAVSTRLASGSYTAPDNTTISAIKAKTDNLPTSPADETLIIAATNGILSRLGTPAGASVSADVAAVQSTAAGVKTTTDKFVFTAPNKVDANITAINSVAVSGNGSSGAPWGP